MTALTLTRRETPVKAIVPQTLEEVRVLADGIFKAGWAAPTLDNSSKVMSAILHGAEIGLPPMLAVQKIAIINNRPSLWGDAVPALLWKHGFDLEETIDIKAGVATCTVTRPGGKKVTRTFSREQAKQAGLLSKKGPWQDYPDRMLAMRARGFAARDGAADLLSGLYLAEEILDGGALTPVEDARSTRPTPETPPLDDVPTTSDAVDPPAPDVVVDDEPDPPFSPEQAKAFVQTVKQAVEEAEISYQPLSEIRTTFAPCISRLPEDLRADLCKLLDIDPETLT